MNKLNNIANNYMQDLYGSVSVTINDMDDDVPYNVDLALSEYSEDDTLTDDEVNDMTSAQVAELENLASE
jgi:hypothetical protein